VLLSAAIHQAAFTALSTIPFAIGQVQDVGLIFCSSIATRSTRWQLPELKGHLMIVPRPPLYLTNDGEILHL
jgi:hypothetical protein